MFFLIVILLLTTANVVQAQSSSERAKEAFSELEADVLKLEQSRQAEFRLYVIKEISRLFIDMKKAVSDSTLNEKILKIVQNYTDSLLVDSLATQQVKVLQFQDYIVHVRSIMNLSDTLAAVQNMPPSASSSTLGVQSTMVNVNKARIESNWSANLKNIPKNWWEKDMWTSKDGLVTFAVGSSNLHSMSLSRLAAATRARARLVTTGKTAYLIGSTPIKYVQQGMSTYCLIAVPTTSLNR